MTKTFNDHTPDTDTVWNHLVTVAEMELTIADLRLENLRLKYALWQRDQEPAPEPTQGETKPPAVRTTVNPHIARMQHESKVKRQRIREYLEHFPGEKNMEIATATGTSKTLVAFVRKELGLPPSPKGRSRTAQSQKPRTRRATPKLPTLADAWGVFHAGPDGLVQDFQRVAE